jgi:hypothetical protein
LVTIFRWRTEQAMLFPSGLKTMVRICPVAASLSLFAAISAFADKDFFETLPNGRRPPAVSGETLWETNFVNASHQPAGNLSGRLIFTCGGHGWTWSQKGWFTQRGVSQEMNEDYGNLDQMNCFIPYAFNAGATVVAFRPVGYQTHEVVLDNDSRSVSFSGKWFKSSSKIFFGKADAVPYRFALLAPTETATATYTPKIPAAGFYPVYTWVRHGPDRTSQLYHILHTGGVTLMRVPHHMVGNGWVYLGTYYFDVGSNRAKGSVVISNLQPSPGFGSVAIADAIRFGNGMGDFVPSKGASISSYPREEEACRYWIAQSFGQGQTNFFSPDSTDHQSGNVGAPIHMAREMNRESEGNIFKRIYLSFHSNAGGGRGVMGLWNNSEKFPGTKTPNQERLAEILGHEVNDTLGALSNRLEVPWPIRTRVTYARDDYAFGEITDKYIGGEFDATILEVAFHDHPEDSKLLRDPTVRDIVGRCGYRGIVRYMNEFDHVPLQFLPNPPQNVRTESSSDGVLVTWEKPVNDATNSPDTYLVYRSENGYGFGNPMRVSAGKNSVEFTNLPKNKVFYFRVTAVNAAGESLPSSVVGAHQPSRSGETKILFVNGFTQFDRVNNPRQTIAASNYVPPSAVGKMERVIPRLNNAFDYVVPHGNALAKNGAAFDSCQREAISQGIVKLDHYSAVIWAAGRQSTNLLDGSEERALAEYLAAGGNLFMSGSRLAESSFTNSTIFPFAQDNSTNASTSCFAAGPRRDSIFRGNRALSFGQGSGQSYFVATANILTPSDEGTREVLRFADGSGSAGVQSENLASHAKIVCFGFPFETISRAAVRGEYLSDILSFFEAGHKKSAITLRLVWTDSGADLIWRSEPGRRYQVQSRSDSRSALWRNIGSPITPQVFTATLGISGSNGYRNYRVLRLN